MLKIVRLYFSETASEDLAHQCNCIIFHPLPRFNLMYCVLVLFSVSFENTSISLIQGLQAAEFEPTFDA